jgi:GT2 family glycosyltransferase
MGRELPVTVVIPAYRRPDMVERALLSVLAQHPRPAEIIVVDDASGDETGSRAASLGAHVITHEQNQGEGASRNTGIRAAHHEWVALLDCDDEWLPGHLEVVWGARGSHVIVATAALTRAEDLTEHRVYGWAGRRPRLLGEPIDAILPENMLVPSAVLLRRSAALAVGGFPVGMRRAGDLDTWVRVLERGSGLAVPRATVIYHLHAGQVSGSRPLMWEAHRNVLDAYSDRAWCTPAVRRRLEGIHAWDGTRAALSEGAPAVPTVLRLGWGLASPQRAVGVLQLLGYRLRGRRLASRLAPDGTPSVALLRGDSLLPRTVSPTVDLRDRSLPAALLYLVRRPASRATVRGRVDALLARALGIEPIYSSGRKTSEPP